MSQARRLCKAEKRMIHRISNAKAGEVCDVTKEVASTDHAYGACLLDVHWSVLNGPKASIVAVCASQSPLILVIVRCS